MNGAINLIRELEAKHDANKLNLAQNTVQINENLNNITENEDILLNLVEMLYNNGTITEEQAVSLGLDLTEVASDGN